MDAFVANLWTWWQGDAAGMIIVTPLILSWHAAGWPRFSPARAVEAVFLAVALAVTAFLIFGGFREDAASISLAFLTLPFIIWAAIRYGPRGVTSATALLCAIAIWHTLKAGGLFGIGSINVSLLYLLTYACTLSITGLVLNTVIRERDRANEELREGKAQLAQRVDERSQELALANYALRRELDERSRYEETLRQNEERFRLLVDGVKDHAIFTLDRDGRVVSWNTGAQSIYGYTSADVIGKHIGHFCTPEDIARDAPGRALERARADGRFESEGWRVRKDGTPILGRCAPDRALRQRGPAARLREDHARPDGAPAARGDAGERAADERVPRDARARAPQSARRDRQRARAHARPAPATIRPICVPSSTARRRT